MRVVTVCLFVATLINVSIGANNKLFATFTSRDHDPSHTQGFFALPRSLNRQASREGWRVVEDHREKHGVAVACRDYDYRVCLLVDRMNSVAGLQFSVSVEDLLQSNAPLKPELKRKITLGTEVYSASVHFVPNAVLKAGGRVMTDRTETAPEGIYIKTEKGLRHVPNKERDLVGSKFVKQRCFPGMGRHYFYDLSKKSSCDTLSTYEALYDEQTHQLVGAVYIAFGNVTVQKSGRRWFESINVRDYMYVAPDSPECTVDYFTQYGAHSLHFYFNEEPWNLKCKDS